MVRNRKGIFAFLSFLFLAIGLSLAVLFTGLHQKALKKILEFSLNQNAKEFFSGTLRIGDFHIDRNLHIHMGDIHGQFQPEKGSTSFLIRSVQSAEPVTNYFSSNGLMLRFSGLRFSSSSGPDGIEGSYKIRGGRDWFVHIEVEVLKLGLEEVEWINPANLHGSSGLMTGNISFRSDSKGKIEFQTKLQIKEPGGELQARFFDLLLPYLPQAALKRKVRTMAHQFETIHFQSALVNADMNQPDQIKILFQIFIPDYNLNLNLNIEVRVEEENSFMKLAELMGLIKNV